MFSLIAFLVYTEWWINKKFSAYFMSVSIWILVLIISLAVLVKSADYFTNFAEKLGAILRIPSFIIGVTVVSIGTSLPELITSVLAVFRDSPEIVMGNIIGSNIANILLIIGVSAVVAKILSVDRDLIDVDIPLMVGGTIVLVIVSLWDGVVTRAEGVMALLLFMAYMWYTLKTHEEERSAPRTDAKLLWIFAGLAATGAGIYAGADFTIRSVQQIALVLHINTSVIALTAVAIGTSLPELIVSVRAAMRGKSEIALGNIFGSNVFNGSFILGVSALIRPLPVTEEVLTVGIPFLVMATALFAFSGISKRVHRYEGLVYLITFVFFIGKLFDLL